MGKKLYMKELADFSKKTRLKYRSYKVQEPKVWSEDDTYKGKKTRALTIILQTRGCTWSHTSGCTMCGYFKDSYPDGITGEEIVTQLEYALTRYMDEPLLKIYTSGSFLDPVEIPFETQKTLFEQISRFPKIKKISIESRPEYITGNVDELARLVKPAALELCIGLESANDCVLCNSINKGFFFKDWLKAAKYVRDHNLDLKTYLLVKPPLLTEKEARDDCIESAIKALELSTSISFNPMNIQSYTLVEWLWEHGEYRPPWLWTIVDILTEVKKYDQTAHLQCDVIAGGQRRGAHNCGKCDHAVLAAIKTFSLTQNIEVLHECEGNYCECKEKWNGVLELEGFKKGFNV